MKSRFVFGAGLGLLACLSTGTVSAHHSFAMFDANKAIKISGTVRDFQWTNPHVWLEVLVNGKAGKPENWSLEGPSVNMLARIGWRAKTFKPGDKVTVEIHPRRDGKVGGAIMTVKMADGKTLGVSGFNPSDDGAR